MVYTSDIMGEKIIPENETEKSERILRVVRGPQWDFLSTLISLPDNPFYDHTEAYVTPIVRELPPPPPNYDQPDSDALAA